MNNPPAFPGKQKALLIKSEHSDIAKQYEIDQNGMTLRDYFAAKAMQAHLSMPETHTAISTNKTTFQNVCGGCYAWADAMLKAREA
jgi:hypothetical protein